MGWLKNICCSYLLPIFRHTYLIVMPNSLNNFKDNDKQNIDIKSKHTFVEYDKDSV